MGLSANWKASAHYCLGNAGSSPVRSTQRIAVFLLLSFSLGSRRATSFFGGLVSVLSFLWFFLLVISVSYALMTPDQAKLILEAHNITDLLDNPGEFELLQEQNPDLLDAYQALLAHSLD